MVKASARKAKPQSAPIALAPIVLIKGAEELLADRALDKLRSLAYQADPQLERTDLNAATYQAGQLDMLTSPSLFGEARMVIISELEAMTEALAQDLLTYITEPVPDVWLFLKHPGGNARGKKVTDAIAKAGLPVILADPLKKDHEKLALLLSDAKAAQRNVDHEAAQFLVDALGNDVRAMAAALAQLLADTTGTVTVDDVRRYYAGRMEADGFEVADAAIAGNTAKALTLARHAMSTCADPVGLVGALAFKIRQMAKVAVTGSAGEARMHPWQFDNVRRQLRGWDDAGLSAAIMALAEAGAEVRGASRDPVYAVEKAILIVCQQKVG